MGRRSGGPSCADRFAASAVTGTTYGSGRGARSAHSARRRCTDRACYSVTCPKALLNCSSHHTCSAGSSLSPSWGCTSSAGSSPAWPASPRRGSRPMATCGPAASGLRRWATCGSMTTTSPGSGARPKRNSCAAASKRGSATARPVGAMLAQIRGDTATGQRPLSVRPASAFRPCLARPRRAIMGSVME